MSDDDDDGVEAQIEDVNEYYFEDGDGKPVCFSILPFQFGEDDNEADFLRKDVVLRGFADVSPHVYKEVVAWKMRLDSEQPNIYVLSNQYKWIKLLKPRKYYEEKFVRSILITVQMLHFVRRGGQRSRLNHLWDHLDEVFGKYNPKPAKDDLMKHHTLIKLFVERDQTLRKSKILQRLLENGFERTKKVWPIMSDDDDDGVEAQIEDVNEYYFVDGDGKPVCFSILPFQFGEDDNEADFLRKDVFLRGFADGSPHVYEVVAWKMRLDSEQPNIYVLSIQHKWIKLVKPRKCYYEVSVRSILITVQMLHFVRRGGQRSCLAHLWDHLDEVFGKYNPKPAADDLMKHHTLIKLFVEKDQTLKKSKILQQLIKNGFERTKKG